MQKGIQQTEERFLIRIHKTYFLIAQISTPTLSVKWLIFYYIFKEINFSDTTTKIRIVAIFVTVVLKMFLHT